MTTGTRHGNGSRKRGAVLFITFLMMLTLSGLALAAGTFARNSQVTSTSQYLDRQALYIAEAGLQRGRQAFAAGTWSANSSHTESFGGGEYIVTLSASSPYTVTSSGYVPTAAAYVARRQTSASAITSSANLSLNPNASAFASSSNGSHTPDKAVDDKVGTNWQADTNGSGSWLGLDFQTATTLNEIIVREDANITSLTIEWSDDDASWTGASGLSISTSGAGNNEVYTATFTAASHRYFRANFTGVTGGKKAAVKEIEGYNTGAVSLTTGTFATQW